MKVVILKYILTILICFIVNVSLITKQQENIQLSTVANKQSNEWNKEFEQLTEENSLIEQEANKYYAAHPASKRPTNPLTNPKKALSLTDSWNETVDFCKRNALYIFTAVGFYFTFYFIKHKVAQATSYLSQPTLWSSWRNDLSFISLVSIPKETLTQWIVEDIQDHYQDNHSIKSFYKDVQSEQAQLQEIMHLYEALNFFYMVDSQALVDVKTRIKVLGLLKDLVLMWELENALAAQQT